MQKQLKWLVLVTVLLAVVVGSLLIFSNPEKGPEKPEAHLLMDKQINDVMKITIKNETDDFVVEQIGGGFAFANINAELLNFEYVQQLIADSAYVEYLELVKDNADDVSVFGLENPVSKVTIQYNDSKELTLWVGNPGPQKNTRYVLDKNNSKVYLFDEAATIRFTMSIKRYLDFVLVPPNEISDVMKTIASVTYEGKMLPRPIVIKKIDETDENQLRQASSFGVASHLMIEPTLQKLDLGEAIDQFMALVGLLGYGVEEYNATPETLKKYGFDDPLLIANFDFSPDGAREAVPYQLKIVQKDQEYFAMVNNNGVIHKIEDEAFLHLSYEKLISRWFYTPLLLDINQLNIVINQKNYDFVIEKPSKNTIEVTLNGKKVDSDAFRKFYNLVVSASHDGTYQPFNKNNQKELMTIEFGYIDDLKLNDVVKYYQGDTRRNKVCFGEVCDFVIRDTYVEFIENAVNALLENKDFRVDWQ